MKIYTKTGDKGETSLFGRTRVPKNHPIIETLGCIDEFNSSLGLALSFLPKKPATQAIHDQLSTIQHTLFDIGAIIASQKKAKTAFLDECTQLLENWIDAMEETLPPLNQFILPGGNPPGATLHLSRAICRRAECSFASLEQANPAILIYFNRLSDYLFVLARKVNFIDQSPELVWKSISNLK